jgi:predicted enzyme related to lactoylglutathione lyase
MTRVGALLAGVALLLAGCDAVKPALPPAERVPVNPIAYVEIPVTDMKRAVHFYEAVLGTDLQLERVDGYEMALFPAVEGAGATAALAKGDVYRPTVDGAIIYFRVTDIDAVLKRATGLGAEILFPKKDVGAFGHVAEIRDTEGNRIALSQPRG